MQAQLCDTMFVTNIAQPARGRVEIPDFVRFAGILQPVKRLDVNSLFSYRA